MNIVSIAWVTLMVVFSFFLSFKIFTNIFIFLMDLIIFNLLFSVGKEIK